MFDIDVNTLEGINKRVQRYLAYSLALVIVSIFCPFIRNDRLANAFCRQARNLVSKERSGDYDLRVVFGRGHRLGTWRIDTAGVNRS